MLSVPNLREPDMTKQDDWLVKYDGPDKFKQCICGHSRSNHFKGSYACITTRGYDYPSARMQFMTCPCKSYQPTKKRNVKPQTIPILKEDLYNAREIIKLTIEHLQDMNSDFNLSEFMKDPYTQELIKNNNKQIALLQSALQHL